MRIDDRPRAGGAARRAAARGEAPSARIRQAAAAVKAAEERPIQRHAVALDKPVPRLILQVAFIATAGLVVTLGGAASVHAGTIAPPGVETSTEAPASEGGEVVGCSDYWLSRNRAHERT